MAEFLGAPGLFRQDLHGRLPQDWLLLFGSLEEENKARLAQPAKFGPAFAGDLSRIGGFAEGRSYAHGQEVWSVDYGFESWGHDDVLEVDGTLPAHLAAIVEEAHKAVAMGLGPAPG